MFKPDTPPTQNHMSLQYEGYCRRCRRTHSLSATDAIPHARNLMIELEDLGRLDYLSSPQEADPTLSVEYLSQSGRGHMFGVLLCRTPHEEHVVLRAFSSLYEGVRDIPGWAPPVLGAGAFESWIVPQELEIKRVTAQLKTLDPGTEAHQRALRHRRGLSRDLLETMQSKCVLTNVRGERQSLHDVLGTETGIPGGVADCCAPKLLNHAALQGLIPLSLVEFHWGPDSPSGARRHGSFYSACPKCRSILGFMLCGLEEPHD